MLSHPTSHSKEITIRDFLVNEFNLPIKDDNQREGIVHRLDRVTSGLMVCVLDENIFEYFQSLPSWFTNLWILVVASIFGIKGTQIFKNGGKK